MNFTVAHIQGDCTVSSGFYAITKLEEGGVYVLIVPTLLEYVEELVGIFAVLAI